MWPLVVSISVLIGSAYIVREDVTRVKVDVKALYADSADKEKRLIRLEEAVKSISEIKDEIKDIRQLMERIMRRRET